jgi:hypothetical protein
MATVVLSGASAELPAIQTLLSLISRILEQSGETSVRVFDLAATPLAYCQGEFDCWVKTQGVCRAHDAEQEIVRAVHDADRLVIVDAATFGGCSYTVKRAVDRLICRISPFFDTRLGLTHHEPRYARMPSPHAVGWQATPSQATADTWRAVADANGVNLFAPHVGACVVDDSMRGTWPTLIADVLASTTVPGSALGDRTSLRETLLAVAAGAGDPCAQPDCVGASGPAGTRALRGNRQLRFPGAGAHTIGARYRAQLRWRRRIRLERWVAPRRWWRGESPRAAGPAARPGGTRAGRARSCGCEPRSRRTVVADSHRADGDGGHA